MTSIFEHTDYRKFLQEIYADRKASNPTFSYEAFARKAGFKSKGFLHHIITGKRNLTKDAMFSLANAIQMDEKSFAYFQAMVAYNQAQKLVEKEYFFKKLLEISPKNSAIQILESSYEFYSKWYYNTVRELITLKPFKGDYALMGSQVNPPISTAQAKKAVSLLLQLGLIEKQRTGYIPIHKSITTGDEDRASAFKEFHRQNLELAIGAINHINQSKRDISSIVVSIPESGFQILKKEIQVFRKRLMKIADEMPDPDQVYHINFQFFPTSISTIEKAGRP